MVAGIKASRHGGVTVGVMGGGGCEGVRGGEVCGGWSAWGACARQGVCVEVRGLVVWVDGAEAREGGVCVEVRGREGGRRARR